jgi:hypothetical protein
MSVRVRAAVLVAGASALLAACAPLTLTQPGAWHPVAPQPQGLNGDRAFGLPDDRVLVLGSRGVAFYDPTTNTWRPGASVPAAVVLGMAVALPDGRLFVTLHSSSGPDTGRVMLYDPGHDRWLDVPPMDVPRENESVTALRDGSVLVAGGYGAGGPSNPIANAIRFDPAHGSWSSAGRLIDARSGQLSTLLADGRVLIVGGTDVNDNQAQLTEIYDPSRNTWTDGGRLVIPGQAPQLIALRDGRVLEIVGFDFVGSLTPVSELYDPRRRSWQMGPPMPSPGGGGLVSMADGRILLVKASLNPTHTVFRAEIFDPQNMRWTASTIVEGEPGALAALHDGRVITIGPTATWIYDPSAVPPPAPGERGIGSPQATVVLGTVAGILALLVLIQYALARAAERPLRQARVDSS